MWSRIRSEYLGSQANHFRLTNGIQPEAALTFELLLEGFLPGIHLDDAHAGHHFVHGVNPGVGEHHHPAPAMYHR